MKNQFNCQKTSQFGALLGLIIVSFFYTLTVHADSNPFALRAPASVLADTEVIAPVKMRAHWMNRLFVEDSKGVMSSMRAQIQAWEEREEYRDNWNLDFNPRYAVVDQEQKANFIRRRALRYLDKRLTGRLKEAPKDSSLYKIAKAQKQLSPSSQVQVSKSFKIKLRAKLLRGEATLRLDNDFIDSEAIVRASGRANILFRKDIKSLGLLTTVDLDARRGVWSTFIDKRINENWMTRFSSEQDNKEMVFSENANSRFELIYTTPF